MKVKIIEHGVTWFLTGLDNEESDCPECGCETNIPDDFELPKKTGVNVTLKCQCHECGCVFVLTRPLKEIEKANKEENE